jgi:putative DNA primase/helicase
MPSHLHGAVGAGRSRTLFAIADALGGDWPERVRTAVVRLFAARDAEPADDIKMELLRDVREVFEDNDRIASATLVEGLCAMEDRPWATWGRGRR